MRSWSTANTCGPWASSRVLHGGSTIVGVITWLMMFEPS